MELFYMKNKNIVKEWIEFSDMDSNLANFTFENMYPKPLELICYHCQQAAEKALKALAIATLENSDVPKTHDLALLAEVISNKFEIDDSFYNACSDLTPYGVKVRYPKEIFVDEQLTKKAIADKNKIIEWVKEKINDLK